MICTGFALYSEGEGRTSIFYKLFGWVFSIFPNSQDIHTWHHMGMWALVLFTVAPYLRRRARGHHVAPEHDLLHDFRRTPVPRRGGLMPARDNQKSSFSASATSCGPTKALACGRWRRFTPATVCRTMSVCSTAAPRASISCNSSRRRDYLLVFDAIDYGLEPGALKIVQGDEVPKFTGAKKMSLHQTGFQEVLSAADLLGILSRKAGADRLPAARPRRLGRPADRAGARATGARGRSRGGDPGAMGRALPRAGAGEAIEPLLGNDIDMASYERSQGVG